MESERSGINADREGFDDPHIDEIHREYERIDSDWLMLHYKTTVGLVAFACIIEFALGLFFINSELLTTTVERYVLKFMLLPCIANFVFIVLDTAAIKSKRLTQKQKTYTVSLVFIIICFVLFTVHSAFSATYYMYAIGIMMTTIYASYRVTSITALSSIASIIVSELFIVWDMDKTSIFESTARMGDFLISIFILIAFSIGCMVVIRFEQKKNEASIQMESERRHLQQILQVDEMTGVLNRKAMHAALKNVEFSAGGDSYILAISDMDNFKGINDQWGHHLGDRCLMEYAKILTENCCKYTPFRYGGDEFCLLFCNVSMDEAVSVCQKIKTKLSELRFEDYPMLKLTASFGLAAYSDQIDTVRLFVHSDYALYEAKELRDTVRVFQKEAKFA